MPLYKYKYIKSGEEREETKDFSDKGALYMAVRAEGGSITSAKEVESKKLSLQFLFSRRGMRAEDKINFARNLAVMVEAGLSISRALSILEKQARSKGVKEIIQNINAKINQGKSLSESLKDYPGIFPPIFGAMVRAGEESGMLGKSLRTIASQLEKAHGLTKKIKGAMIYPSIIISLMFVVGFLMMTFMVPQITETFKGLKVELPLATRVLIDISEFLAENTLLILGALLVSFFALMFFFRSEKGKWLVDFLVLHIPIIKSMTRDINSARTSRTLASLSSSGVEIIVAVQVTRDVLQNGYYKAVMDRMAKGLETGETMSAVFREAENLYPVLVSEMTAVGEETGNLPSMLDNIANFYESEVEEKTKNLSTLIEPFLMIVIGITVGFFAVAMLAPTYSLVDVIGA